MRSAHPSSINKHGVRSSPLVVRKKLCSGCCTHDPKSDNPLSTTMRSPAEDRLVYEMGGPHVVPGCRTLLCHFCYDASDYRPSTQSHGHPVSIASQRSLARSFRRCRLASSSLRMASSTARLVCRRGERGCVVRPSGWQRVDDRYGRHGPGVVRGGRIARMSRLGEFYGELARELSLSTIALKRPPHRSRRSCCRGSRATRYGLQNWPAKQSRASSSAPGNDAPIGGVKVIAKADDLRRARPGRKTSTRSMRRATVAPIICATSWGKHRRLSAMRWRRCSSSQGFRSSQH